MAYYLGNIPVSFKKGCGEALTGPISEKIICRNHIKKAYNNNNKNNTYICSILILLLYLKYILFEL